jgi:photosystem II stability/assembly factor-like uncharacterized protein
MTIFAVAVAAFCASAFGSPNSTNALSLQLHAASVNFEPISFSFASAQDGWVVGVAPCPEKLSCLSLRETTSHGRSWLQRSLPSVLIAQANRNTNGTALERDSEVKIHFANKDDGWIFGLLRNGPIFWSTHDGGRKWRRLSTALMGPYGSIYDIESTRQTAYLIAQNKAYRVSLESSPVGRDDWRAVHTPILNLPAGGAEPGGSIVLKGTAGWLIVGNDRGVSGSARLSANGSWVKWTPPCYSVGNSYVTPVALTTRNLMVVCQMGGFASPLSKMAPPGAKLQSNWLYFSNNGGRTFTHGAELRPNPQFDDLQAVPARKVIVLGRILEDKSNNTQQLVRSTDDGQHWTVVYQGGWVISLAFQSAQQGVALVQPTNGTNSMIMTFDGGRHWAPVAL